jgi:hypothetical protein
MSCSVLGLVKIRDGEYMNLLDSLSRHYKLDADYAISYHSPYHAMFTNYDWRRRWAFNNRWRVLSIHGKRSRVDTIGYVAKTRIWDRIKRRPTWRNAFIKECPVIPIEFTHQFHDVQHLSIDTAHPVMEEALRYLHSPQSQAHMETFITYALSRLTETGQAPTFPLFYGAWRTTMREWTKDMSDCPELEEIEQYIENTKDIDEESWDPHEGRRKIVKTDYSIYEYKDGSIWCSVNHFPVQLLATEKLESDLYNLAREATVSSDELLSMWWQVVFGIMMYQRLGITHNDLHASNVMFKRTTRAHLFYDIDGTIYKVPTYGRLWKIIDFGRGTYESVGLNTAYNANGECYNLLFPRRPNGRGRRPISPHFAVDIMTLAMNIVMDVTENTEYFEQFISDPLTGQRVCFLDKEVTFKDHMRIIAYEPPESWRPAAILRALAYPTVIIEELPDGEEIWGIMND